MVLSEEQLRDFELFSLWAIGKENGKLYGYVTKETITGKREVTREEAIRYYRDRVKNSLRALECLGENHTIRGKVEYDPYEGSYINTGKGSYSVGLDLIGSSRDGQEVELTLFLKFAGGENNG
jgi:hypothetical protein